MKNTRILFSFLVLALIASFSLKANENSIVKGNKHIIFIDIWSLYQNAQLLDDLVNLPTSFKNEYHQVLVQPQMNVTQAQLDDFVAAYQLKQPVLLDAGFKLVKRYGRWKMPFHTLLKNGEIVFQGDHAQFMAHFFNTKTTTNPPETKKVPVTTAIPKPETVSKRLAIGDNGYLFDGKGLNGESYSLTQALSKISPANKVHLVFMDALCPMPHFPNCEAQFAQLRAQIKHQAQDKWLGVLSSFYIDKTFAQGFLNRQQIKIDTVFDSNNTIFRNYGVFASPYIVSLDHQGVIVSRGEIAIAN